MNLHDFSMNWSAPPGRPAASIGMRPWPGLLHDRMVV
jgi:hypothetical protein